MCFSDCSEEVKSIQRMTNYFKIPGGPGNPSRPGSPRVPFSPGYPTGPGSPGNPLAPFAPKQYKRKESKKVRSEQTKEKCAYKVRKGSGKYHHDVFLDAKMKLLLKFHGIIL